MRVGQGASLQDHINALKEKGEEFAEARVWRIATQICSGLRYIHNTKKVSRSRQPFTA